MDDHSLPWLVDLLRERIKEMRPRERTLTLKLCRGGAKKLLANLQQTLEARTTLQEG